MGSIVKRGQKYQVKQRAPGGHWWTATAPTLADARQLRAEMESAAARGADWQHPRARRPLDPRLRTAAERFLAAEAQRLRPLTIRRYGLELERFVSWAEAQRQGHLRHLTRALIQTYAAYLQATPGRRPRSVQAIAKCLDVVGAWWHWLHEHDDEHGLGAVDKPRRVTLATRHTRVTTAPSWAAMDAMLEHLSGWSRRLAVIQRCCGLRMSEGLALRWDDFDLDMPQLRVRAEICKGGRGGRVVPLSPHLVAELRTWPRDAELVCGPGADRYRHRSEASRLYTRAWRAAGVPEVYWAQPSHALRKGFVSGLLALGARADAVEFLVGHSLGEVRQRYIDPIVAFDLKAQVALVPPLGTRARSPGVPGGV